MRKVYDFKKLTEKVKQIAVLMLMLVMTAGSLFAEEVTFVFAEAGFTNGQVLPNGDINGIISYSADQQGSSTDGPKYYNSGAALRFYPGSNNTQGNAMILTPAFGYQITGLTINALSTYSPVIGYMVDGGEALLVEADEELVYTISDIEAVSSLKFYNAGTSQLRITSITITYTTAEVPTVAVPTFSPEPGICTLPINVSLSCATPGALIYYTFNDSQYYVLYDSAFSVSTTATIHAFAVLGNDTSAMAHATYVFPQSVNLYGFKYGVPGSLYMIPNANEKLDFVFRDGRNLYFMAEQSAASRGLLVYDNNPAVITTQFTEGETVDMLIGTLSFYNGIPELIPVANPGIAENSTPHSIVPEEVTVAELMANPDKYISALVIIKAGQFQSGTFTTSSKTGVNFVQGTDTIVIYNNFKKVTATFEGGENASVVGLVGMYNGIPQIYPRGNNVMEKKGHTRDFMQVLANGLMATIAALLWSVSLENKALVMFGAAVAEAASDTFAGEIGRLSKRQPVSILSFKPVQRGLSGGITVLGLIAAMLSSAAMALCWYLWFFDVTVLEAVLVGTTGFAGCLLDSVLGAGVQGIYYDPKTKQFSEDKEKDGKALELSRGIRWVDNDVVNLMSNVFSGVFAFGMCALIL